jgi:crotonobetainyl-CoA:carnitine CoA-transferase CaiB-like acyl-CoA transferase
VQVLDTVFAQRHLADWRTRLDAAGVTFGAVQSVNETADDTQMHQIGALVPFANGAGLTVSSPFQLEGEMKVAPRRAPAIGEHTDVVLREAGYAPEEIERLHALGVLA